MALLELDAAATGAGIIAARLCGHVARRRARHVVQPPDADLLHGEGILIRKGKRAYAVVTLEG